MKIAKIIPATFGHLILELEDGVQKILHRGSHEHLSFKVGDEYPPVENRPVLPGELATIAAVPVDSTVQVASHTEPDVATQLDAAPPAPEPPADPTPAE